MLPSKTAQFAEAGYWDKFFEERKKQAGKKSSSAFEWYGVFKDDLLDLVKANHSPKHAALVLGCGNSTLSEDLLQTKCAGRVVSVDFSQNAIDEMKAKTRNEPRLEWVLGDVTSLPLDYTEVFDVAWDKGGLDAILGDADGDESCLESGRLMIMEALRCLKPGGKYFCVSLLQEHVLRTLLDTVIASIGFESVHLTAFNPKADSALCPFLIVLTKAQESTVMFSQLYVSLESKDSVAKDIFVQHVHTSQKAYAARKELKKIKPGSRGSFNLMSPTSPWKERFKLSIVDTMKTKIPLACLILPQGREHEWMFSSEEGQIQLATSNEIGRLIVVSLAREETFNGGMEGVQKELNSSVLDFAPKNLPKGFKVPYMAVAQDLGKRTTIATGESQYAGKYFVEDVEINGEVFRRLIFANNPLAIQSEAKIVVSGKKSIVDVNHLSFDFHQVMLGFSKALFTPESLNRAAICGLGAGSLYMALTSAFPKALIDGIDIDPHVVQVAKEWFGLTVSDESRIRVQDALKYLHTVPEEAKLDLVLLDINGADDTTGLRFPPIAFFEKPFFELLKDRILNPDTGVALINFGCRTDSLTRTLLADARRVFDGNVVIADMSELSGDLNMIVCLSQKNIFEHDQDKLLATLGSTYDDLISAIRLVNPDGTLSELSANGEVETAGSGGAKQSKSKKKKKKSKGKN